MDNQNYHYPQMSSEFLINVRKSNSVPAAFQSEDEMDVVYAQNQYQPVDGNYYEPQQQNGDISQDGYSTPISSNSRPAPSNVSSSIISYSDNNGPTQTSDNQQYGPNYHSQTAINVSTLPYLNSLHPSGGTEFVSNVPQSQECVDPFQATSFPGPNHGFANNIQSSHHQVDLSSLQQNGATTASTEFTSCDHAPEMLFPSVTTEPPVVCTNCIPSNYEPIPPVYSYNEQPLNGGDLYSQCQTSSFPPSSSNVSVCVPELENQFQQNLTHSKDQHNDVVPPVISTDSNPGLEESIVQSKAMPTSKAEDEVNIQCSYKDFKVPSQGIPETTWEPTNKQESALLPSAQSDFRLETNVETGSAKIIPPTPSPHPIVSCDMREEVVERRLVTEGKQQESESRLMAEPASEPVTSPEKSCPPDNSREQVCEETLEDLTNSLAEDIATTSNNTTTEERSQKLTTENDEPLSPMITVMDSTFGEDETGLVETVTSSENDVKDVELIKSTDADKNTRVTRSGTGTVRNRTQRYIEELHQQGSSDSSHEICTAEEWEYEEGSELAPSIVDPSVIVPENVVNVTPEELDYYQKKFADGVESVLTMRLHCTTCNRHIGSAPNYLHLGNRHKVLRVLICNRCRSFYGEGKFPKDSDGSELYCRWCGQGGQVICCSTCPNVFCEPCIKRNFGQHLLNVITGLDVWHCFLCNHQDLWELRSICWAVLTYTMKKKRDAIHSDNTNNMRELEEDRSKCCNTKNHRKRKPQTKSRASGADANSSQRTLVPQDDSSFSNFEFGHFLFDNDNFPSDLQAEQAEDEEYLDPSQFVQPVLEDPPPARPPLPRLAARTSANLVARPAPRPQPVQARPLIAVVPASVGPVGPRIVVKQGNLMTPGLVPFNNQPNRNRVAAAPLPLPGASGSIFQGTSLRGPPSTTVVRNPAHPYLNNIEGVRSLDQMHSLNQVPWLRDGIDNVRATGYALTKRIRELEARFHSVKNKQDVEKVMQLGKKLERLTERTMLRYKQLNRNIKESCKSWYIKRLGINSTKAHNLDPLCLYGEGESDWDDDMELSKPLEKVMIPVSSSAIHGTNIRPTPRPVVVTNYSPLMQASGSGMPSRNIARPHPQLVPIRAPAPSVFRASAPKVYTPYPSANPQSFPRVKLPGPKSGQIRYRQNSNVFSTAAGRPVVRHASPAGVGAFLNERNGFNTISVSLATPSKRKRQESDSSDSSDIVVCPTIPELLKMHNVKPCKVLVTRDDEYIVSFLQEQEQKRQLNGSNKQETPSDSESSESIKLQEIETAWIHCETPLVPEESVVQISPPDVNVVKGCAEVKVVIAGDIEDDDDDIEIIE